MPSPPKTQYTKSGGLHIAYQLTGKGPFDLVFVPGFVSKNQIEGNIIRTATPF